MATTEHFTAIWRRAAENLSSKDSIHLAHWVERAAPGLTGFLEELRAASSNRFVYLYSLDYAADQRDLPLGETNLLVFTNIPCDRPDEFIKLGIDVKYGTLTLRNNNSEHAFTVADNCLVEVMEQAIKTGMISGSPDDGCHRPALPAPGVSSHLLS